MIKFGEQGLSKAESSLVKQFAKVVNANEKFL
jgi:hypothetical protein